VITVYVDASVQPGRTGGIGVVLQVEPPITRAKESMEFSFPISGTLSVNDAEIIAFAYAAKIVRGVASKLRGLSNTIINLRSDSAAAVNAIKNPKTVKNRQTRNAAKNVKPAIDDLTHDGIILGWGVKKIGRRSNLADRLAAKAREEYGSIFKWTPENQK